MDRRTLARALALTRVGIGVGFLVAPRVAVRVWTGERATVASALAARSVGGRDLALGAGALAALSRGRDARTWLRAGAVADAADALGMLAGVGRLPRARAALLLTSASVAAIAGLGLSGRLR